MSSPLGYCCICFLAFSPGDVYNLKCGHTFHKNCITRWFCNGQTCPRCTRPSTVADLVKIYFEGATEETSQQLNSLIQGSGLTPGSFTASPANQTGNPIQVIVRDATLDMKFTIRNLREHSTVQDLKKAISEYKGIDVELQRLLYAGAQIGGQNAIENNRTLSSYKIGNYTIVELTFRQRGGK